MRGLVVCIVCSTSVISCTAGGGAEKSACDTGSQSLTVEGLGGAAKVAIYGPDSTLVGVYEDGDTVEAVPAGAIYEIRRGAGAAGGVEAAVDLGVGAVEDCSALLTVATAPQATAGAIWTSTWEQLLAYTWDGAALAPVGAPLVPLSNSINALAIDASGNLWAATPWTYGARFVVLAPGQQHLEGEVAPALELSAPSLVGDANVTSLFFDDQGNLWATTGTQIGGYVGVVGWSAATLRAARLAGGAVEAEPTWAAQMDGATTLSGGARVGDTLYVSAEDEGLILSVPLAEVQVDRAAGATVAPTHAVSLLQDEDAAWRGLTGLAPGPDGGLAVLAATSGAILELPAADLNADGAVLVAGTQMGVTALPQAIAADGAGGVWFSDTGALGWLSRPGAAPVVYALPEIARAGAVGVDLPPG